MAFSPVDQRNQTVNRSTLFGQVVLMVHGPQFLLPRNTGFHNMFAKITKAVCGRLQQKKNCGVSDLTFRFVDFLIHSLFTKRVSILQV